MNQEERQADWQAERLQSMLERLAGGEVLGDVLPHAPGEGPSAAGEQELAELARLGHALALTLPGHASAPFKARLQADLQARMIAARPARRSAARRWMPRMAAASLALVLAMASAVMASADSLPGQPLYSVKRVVEGTRLALSANDATRARVRLDIARTRVDELKELVDRGGAIDPALVDDLVAAHDAAARAAGTVGDDAMAAAVAASSYEAGRLVKTARERIAGQAAPAVATAAAWGASPPTAAPSPTPVERPPTIAVTPIETAAPILPATVGTPARRTVASPTPTPRRLASPSSAASRPRPSPHASPTQAPDGGPSPMVTSPPTAEAPLVRGVERTATMGAPTHTAPPESEGSSGTPDGQVGSPTP